MEDPSPHIPLKLTRVRSLHSPWAGPGSVSGASPGGPFTEVGANIWGNRASHRLPIISYGHCRRVWREELEKSAREFPGASHPPGGSAGKETAWNVGDLGSIPGLEISSGGGHGNPLQYSSLENPHRGVWRATVHGGSKSQT